MEHSVDRVTSAGNNTRVYRWYFYIALAQFLLYFIVPLLLFRNRAVVSVEVVSALTLGLAVGGFFLIVSILGLVLDKARRMLYAAMCALVALYFLWAVVSWAYIEHMDYLLR